MKFSPHLRIKPGPARYQITHPVPENLMDLPEEDTSRIEANLAQHSIQRHQSTHAQLRELTALRNFFENALVNEIEKLWDHGKGCDPPLAEGAEQVVGIQGFQINHAGSGYEWQQQIGHLGEGVKERQQAKHSVLWPDAQYRKNSLDLTHQVGMGKHYALGVGGGARGIEQGGHAFGRNHHRTEAWGTGRKNRVQLRHRLSFD